MPSRLPAVLGMVALWLLCWSPASLHANSLCDLVSSNPPYIGGPATSPTSLLNVAFDASVEVSKREMATLHLCVVARKGDREVTDGLVILTTDEEATIRKAALQMLAVLGTADHRDVVSRALLDKSPQVRGMAVATLSQLACEGCLDPVVGALEDPSQPADVRISAVVALGKHRYKGGLAALREQLADAATVANVKNPEARDLQVYSAIALAQFGDEAGLSVLAESALAPETREGLRAKAVMAIESLTGMEFGYVNRYFAPTTREQRLAALSRLADWWKNEGGEVPR